MIKSFKDDLTETVFEGRSHRRFPANLLRVARRKLEAVNAAIVLDDLKAPPGNRLHALTGDRLGQHAVRVNDQYRVCFVWDVQDAYDVELTDYH